MKSHQEVEERLFAENKGLRQAVESAERIDKILKKFDKQFPIPLSQADENGGYDARPYIHALLSESIRQAIAEGYEIGRGEPNEASYEAGKKEEREMLRGVIENTFTVYYRSIYSQDCSRDETEEEKRTEMIKLSDVIDLLSSLQDNPK